MANLLKPRLQCLADMVDQGAVLIDIGSDHGYLVIDLALRNIINKGYACDVNEGPLQNAKNNIDNYDLAIECILSDGFKDVNVDDYDTITIAGMGGSLIVDILKQHPNLSDKTLILQPNINSYAVRKFLKENNLRIIEEALVKENDIIYEIIKVKGQSNKDYTDFELRYGAINLKRNSELIKEKLKKDYFKQEAIIAKITDDNRFKFIKLNEDIKEYLDEN